MILLLKKSPQFKPRFITSRPSSRNSFGARISFPIQTVKLRWNNITDLVSLQKCGGLGLHTDRRSLTSRTSLNLTSRTNCSYAKGHPSAPRTDQIHLLTAIKTYFLKFILMIRSSPWLLKKPSAQLNVSPFELFTHFLIPYRS